MIEDSTENSKNNPSEDESFIDSDYSIDNYFITTWKYINQAIEELKNEEELNNQ